ncbi:hypothetical protein ACT3HK_10915 [Thermolongibacillus altinsuensis]
MKKWIIITASVLLLLIGGAGAYYYFLNNKEYDISKDKEVAKIVEDDYEIVLPDEHTNGQKQENANEPVNNQKQQNQNEHAGNKTGQTNAANSSTQGNSGQNEQTTEVTVASIKAKYRPVFESLQQQANGKIEALLAHAFAEYKQKKANGESVSYSYFYAKYNSAAKALEAKTDAAFNKIYAALEKELKQHGFSPNHAKEFREAYEQEKESRRSALLKKAMEKL